jgi:hypothetical protein
VVVTTLIELIESDRAMVGPAVVDDRRLAPNVSPHS